MKKITFLFALLCASVMAFADWTGQVVGHVTNVWLDGIGSNEDRTEFDYAVNYLTEYDNGALTITIDYATANFDKIVGLVPKIIVNGAYAGDFSAKQWSSSTYQAGATLSIYFQFDYNGGGNGSSQFQYTIPSGGSTPDPDPTPVIHTYCDSEIGHEANPNAATNSFILLSVSADGEGHTTVTIKQDAEKNSEMFDYLQVTNYAATGSDVTEGGSNKMEVTFNTPTADANGEITLEILWSTVGWGGRWMVQNLKVSATATCAAPDTEKPSMSAASVSVDSKTHNYVVLAISDATDNVAVTKYVVKNHSDNSAVGEYTPAEGKITVSALSPSTAYDWDIYAKDAAGNVSDNSKNITFTTDALVSNYCGETLSDGNGATVDMTCEFKNNKYVISFSNPTLSGAASTLAGFNGSYCTVGGTGAHAAWDNYSVNTSEKIVLEFEGVPNFYTDLYINIPNAQRTFLWPNDVVWGSCPAVAVTGVSLNHNALEMLVGGATQTLTATIAPTNATNQNVTWESDDTSVATVENGVVTAVGAGSATITVTTVDGSFTDDCNVTVTVPSITAATYNGYGSVKGVYALYAITRNIDQSVTFSAKAEAAFGIGKRIHYYKGGVADVWKDLEYNSVTGTYDYTAAAGSFVDGDEWVAEFYFPFTGDAASIVCNYTVGSEQGAPANIPVGAVVLNKVSSTLSVGETDNLTATVYPSFATSASTVTWASDATDYATVDAGTVTAVAAGSANITASCGGVTSDPCAVTVAASLTEAKFYGVGTFTDYSDAKKAFAYEFCFTRATDHKVTLDVVFSEDVSGVIANDADFGFYINNVGNHLTYNANTKTASYNFGTQSENAEITYRFRFVMPGGLHETENTTYTVGSYNDKVYACVVTENSDNAAVLAAYDGRTAQVIVDRSFTAGSLYTLVLPFNADASVLPGQLTKLNNTIVKDNGDLKVNFVDASAIEAGVPYLYVPSADVVNPVFAGVTVSKDLNPTEPADGKAAYYGIYAPTTGSALKAISNAYVLGSDQYLYAASGLNDDQPMKALRGYFVLNFPASQAPNRTARVIFNYNDAETATGIEGIQPSAVSCQKVIENGQLFIIRDGKMYNAQGQLIK